jgi:hypothetical protein
MMRAALLDAYILRASERGPFDWAENNCCHFAMGWVAMVEGRDPMDDLEITPNKLAAWRLIHSFGGLAETISQQMGRSPIHPAEAQLGDVVLYQLPDGYSVGICAGRTSMLIDETGASQHVPTLQCLHAWRVG